MNAGAHHIVPDERAPPEEVLPACARRPILHPGMGKARKTRGPGGDGHPVARFYSLLQRRIVIVLSVLFVAAGAFLVWHQWRLHSRIAHSMSRRIGGTGLGLAISARLVCLKGGRLRVDSYTGKGATFHFTMEPKAVDGGAAALAELARTE